MMHTLTYEQRAIVESNSEVIIAHAFAGCTKTSTLEAYARARPNLRFLYIAFNKAIQKEASARFPSNVKAMTVNGLAFASHGRKYAHKVENSLSLTRIIDVLGHGVDYRGAALLKQTLTAFMVSAEQDLEAFASRHLIGFPRLVPIVVELWSRMIDPTDIATPMMHDGYLKLYQLSFPDLSSRYDVLLLDEAQDTNPVTLDIVARQRIPKLLVGDKHQQIYTFRGAIDAMDCLIGDDYSLTQSFRFGPAIADLASEIVSLKGDDRRVIGAGTKSSVGMVDRSKPFSILCRTNAGVFEQAVKNYDGQKLLFIGGINSYSFDKVLDAYYLQASSKSLIKDSVIRGFGSFDALQQFAKDTDDPELKMLDRIVTEYGKKIPDLIARIRRSTVEDPAKAQICMSTVHKAKGLGFRQVKLGDDFKSLKVARKQLAEGVLPKEDIFGELNLLYVGMTRTIERLEHTSRASCE